MPIDAYWADLTDEQKAAAGLLGYTEKSWDGDDEISICDYDWKEMSTEQQEAAKVLGYTKDSWDEDD